MRRIWIDTDLGFDDLVAIAMVAGARDVEVCGLSLVAGNASLPQVVRNAREAAAFLDWPMPIFAGLAKPLCGDLVTAAYALGDRAMPTVGRSLPSTDRTISAEGALPALTRYLESGGSEILALGPLANIAALAAARPDLARRIGRLVWMGGSAGPGNHTAAAEFNAAVDPEAVQVLLAAGIELSMVGLDACRPVRLATGDTAVLRALGGDRADILCDLLDGFIGVERHDRIEAQPIYDPVAAAAWLDPDAVAFRPARLDIELRGQHTRGMTVIEWRIPGRARPNATIATAPDVGRVRAMILETLERLCRRS